MSIRKRNAIDTIPGVTMMVRTMSGLGASYEQFEPYSLDEGGAMLVLRSKADPDAPLRVIVNAPESIARQYAKRFEVPFEKLKQNADGSYQIFGNWLKVMWSLMLDRPLLEIMGCNKLLWEIYDAVSNGDDPPFQENAKLLMAQGQTSNMEVMMLLQAIVNGETLEFPFSLDGLQKLARSQEYQLQKMLYCLLGGYTYADLAQTVTTFETNYMRDPFQKRYGVLHGTMALNQGNENWEQTFAVLREWVEADQK